MFRYSPNLTPESLFIHASTLTTYQPLGLYRDDALAISRGANRYTLNKWKDLISSLRSMGLKITIETNITYRDLLDIAFNLGADTCKALLQTKQEGGISTQPPVTHPSC